MLFLIVILVFAELALLALYVNIRRNDAEGPRWWIHEILLAAQTLYWIGACFLLVRGATDQVTRFVLIACIAHLSLTAGALVAISGPTAKSLSPGELARWERLVAVSMGLVSMLACVAFVAAVVFNNDLGPILLGVIAGDEDFVSYRLIMSTGRAIYLAPGYLKQFRDVLLPGAFLALMIGTRTTSRIFLTLMWVSGFVAAVLSGERSVLMIHVYVLGVGLIFKQGRSAHSRRILILTTMSLGVSAFVGFTFLLGRTTIGASFFKVFMESLWGLFERISLVVPAENAESFPIWGAIAPTWGKSWASELAGILPGVQNSLSNDLHAVLGGSPLGNSTLGMSADVFLAWGVIGVVIVPFLFIYLLSRLDRNMIASQSQGARIMRMVFAPLTLAWYSQFLFILNGGLVLTVVSAIARRLPARDSTA